MAYQRAKSIILLLALLASPAPFAFPAQPSCVATPSDVEGPFYKPDAPRRSKTGTGLVIRGAVRSARDCRSLGKARIEWWQANPQSVYDDDHRATMQAGEDGNFLYETNFPPPYSRRRPHIHVKVFAPGHRPLTTQIYPRPGQKEIQFDFVLRPE